MRATGAGKRLLGAIVLAFVSMGAFGQAEFQLLVHPKASALGNAVTADPPGIMALRRNPAGLSRLEGRQWEFGLVAARTVFEAEFSVPDEGCDIFGMECAEHDPAANSKSRATRGALFVPGVGLVKLPKEAPFDGAPTHAGFSVQPPGSKLTFGNGAWMEVYAGFSKDDDDPGRYQIKDVALQRFTYFAPTVAYQVNDNWSIGAGINFSHHAFGATQDLRTPNMLVGVGATLQDAFGCDEEKNEPLAPWLALCGGKIGPWQDIGVLELEVEETLSPSYRFGVLWEPTDWFTWGAQYSSGDDMSLSGELGIDYTEDWSGFWQSVNSSVLGAIGSAILSLPSGIPKEQANISLQETHPQHFSTGISARVLPWLTINTDVDYVDMNSQEFIDIKFDRELEFLNAARILAPEQVTPTSLRLERNKKDVWSLGYGAEFHVSSRLDLRAGVQHRNNAIRKGGENLSGPLWDANLYGVGLGYEWSQNTHIDMHASWLKSSKKIPADSSCSINCDNITNIVDNPYAGLDVYAETHAQLLGISVRSRF
ncbi:long-subunit fatty acid transport protein [Halospina denitrificans]|uniref:Long-subunit fatty acid transport protein n=1 Tax=Halospina denitrificans TaxID=332522 RepID=A0A4V3EQA6_9GAMM|nr:outer membrane protein transport protein [Halospina denitrificans]TDT39388.1 long-subunit fatty acid transport protein [Halospina denitrificans]